MVDYATGPSDERVNLFSPRPENDQERHLAEDRDWGNSKLVGNCLTFTFLERCVTLLI